MSFVLLTQSIAFRLPDVCNFQNLKIFLDVVFKSFGFFQDFWGFCFGILWEDFFGRNFWEEFFVYVVKVIRI